MRLDEYNPTSICRALGLDGFRSQVGRNREMTLLLCPSFAPEVLLRFSSGSDGNCSVRLICAKTQIWAQQHLGHVATASETTAMESTTLAELEAGFRQGVSEPAGGIALDGMIVHIEWRSFSSRLTIENVNPSSESSLRRLAANALTQTYSAINSKECRNGLSQADAYVGLQLPMEDLTEDKPRLQLGVLGVREEQAEFLAGISAVADRQRSKPE